MKDVSLRMHLPLEMLTSGDADVWKSALKFLKSSSEMLNRLRSLVVGSCVGIFKTRSRSSRPSGSPYGLLAPAPSITTVEPFISKCDYKTSVRVLLQKYSENDRNG